MKGVKWKKTVENIMQEIERDGEMKRGYNCHKED